MRHGVALVLALSLITTPAAAKWKSKHVDGVIASVDKKPITLSQVRARAKPLLMAMPKGDLTPEVEDKMMRELVDLMIKERLIQADVERLRIEVSSEDVDRAIKYLADANKLTEQELLAQADKAGMGLMDYRAELRRQIVEGKWERQRVTPGVAKKALLDELAVTYRLERDLL